ncbi:hypothetical protein BgiMline_029174 [Biomphalaria glabrata]|nr:hypothetical protein BgiMline_025801 [Biomphalaria glabrata]
MHHSNLSSGLKILPTTFLLWDSIATGSWVCMHHSNFIFGIEDIAYNYLLWDSIATGSWVCMHHSDFIFGIEDIAYYYPPVGFDRNWVLGLHAPLQFHLRD